MRFIEGDGSSDFDKVFSSVAEEIEEERERKQTELFLRVLDDLEDGRAEAQRNVDRRKPQRENMRVSILDDDENDHKKKRRVVDRRVHTLDDLPKDDPFDIIGPVFPDPPELSIEAGRRLRDGKVSYRASLPGWFDDVSFDSLPFSPEMGIMLILGIFFLGLWLGRRALRSKAAPARSPPHNAVSPQIVYAFPSPTPGQGHQVVTLPYHSPAAFLAPTPGAFATAPAPSPPRGQT